MSWAEHEACMGGKRKAYNSLVENTERNRMTGRPRRFGDISVKIVTKLGFGISVIRIPLGATDFSLLQGVQTGSVADDGVASYSIGTRGFRWGGGGGK
jgi:hypothetical protein